MSFEGAKRGIHVSSGSGIVAHLDGLTAFATGGDDDQLNSLLIRFNALSGQPWTEVIRALTAEINAVGFDAHPDIACVSVEPGRVAAFVFGAAKLSLEIDGAETLLDGRDSSTWIDVALHGEVERVLAGTQSGCAIVGVLRDGVIPAGGFMLDTVGPMPTPGRWTEEGEEVELGEGAMAPEPPTSTHAEETPDSDQRREIEPTEASEPDSVEAPAPAIGAAGLFSRIEERNPAANHTPTASAIAEDTAEDIAAPIDPEPLSEAEPATDPELASEAEPALETELESEAEWSAAPELSMTNPNASVFEDPDLIDATEAPQALSVQGEVQTAQPAEPSPIAALTQVRPQLRGVRCDAGHLTAPNHTPCVTCGTQVDPNSEEETGDRPVLGRLIFDDGAVMNIDRPAAIGTNVPAGYEIQDEAATIVRLDDGVGGIEDLHIEVRLSGWQVDVIDVSSTGGTYSLIGGERQTRTKLRSGQSVTLQPGMRIEVGRRSFTFSVGPNPPPAVD